MLDLAQIREVLPHGYPMVLVDRIVAVVPGQSIVGIKAITASEPCYASVPRGRPATHYAYPASLLLESFGQTAAVLWLHSARLRGVRSDEILMFAVARDCVIEGIAVPGDLVRHEARLTNTVGDNIFVSGNSWVGERRIATFGSMVATLRPRVMVRAHAHGRQEQ
jgi:3-hydroxyacyl-[acyl-carrier-protein] dehydratase